MRAAAGSTELHIVTDKEDRDPRFDPVPPGPSMRSRRQGPRFTAVPPRGVPISIPVTVAEHLVVELELSRLTAFVILPPKLVAEAISPVQNADEHLSRPAPSGPSPHSGSESRQAERILRGEPSGGFFRRKRGVDSRRRGHDASPLRGEYHATVIGPCLHLPRVNATGRWEVRPNCIVIRTATSRPDQGGAPPYEIVFLDEKCGVGEI